MRLLERIWEYGALCRGVRSKHGVPILRQLSEIARLACSTARLGPGDYYLSAVFDPRVSPPDKLTFAGWRAQARLDALNDSSWRCLALDKVLMYSVLHANGVRIPQTRAIYLPGSVRRMPGAVLLDSPEALESWLREADNYPFFSKPSASGFARGAAWAEVYEPAGDRIRFRDGNALTVHDFRHGLYDCQHLGYLFQAPIQPDGRLVPALGAVVSSLRMAVLYDEHEGPLLHHAHWKLPTGKNMVDNYNGGRTGNLVAAIDPDSGGVTRVIRGTGLDVVEVDRHPDTDVAFRTVVVPDWPRVVDFVLDAALTLPRIRFQQWDIALADGGPLAIEVNLYGNLRGCDLAQILYRKGLLDRTMQSFLARHGL